MRLPIFYELFLIPNWGINGYDVNKINVEISKIPYRG